MTDCISQLELFPTCKSRKVIFDFQGGDITSDAGVMLLRLADRRLGLTKELARRIPDTRSKAHGDHSLSDLLRQRIYAIALGYEDLNDHNTLRHDIALQTAVGRDEAMGSASTLCRLENRANRETARIICNAMGQSPSQHHSLNPPEAWCCRHSQHTTCVFSCM